MLTRVHLKAPQEDRTALIDPPWESLGPLLSANREQSSHQRLELLGRSSADIAREARRELIRDAYHYTHWSADIPAELRDAPVVMAGHQPELFHPGVWFKNFALDALARQQRAVGINLIVDSDTLRTPSLRVPGGSIASPTARAIPFDAPGPELPYEERLIQDPAMFASFGNRVAAELAPLVPDPLIKQLWPLVSEQMQHCVVGYCLARGRRLLEAAWGLTTLEIPQSHICESRAFKWFAAHLLADLPRFHEIYNAVVDEYRRINRIRSVNHPVPKLERDDDWFEAPFWIWRSLEPRRRRVFVRRQGPELIVSDRADVQARLPLTGDPSRMFDALMHLHGPGLSVKLRTRALITTMWARLFLSDLFLHGIGGAKYDQLTDEIIRRFFGCEPPRYATISATLHLPIERPMRRHAPQSGLCDPATCHTATPLLTYPDELHAIERRLRELTFHPEALIDREDLPAAQATQVDPLISDKAGWIATPSTRGNAKLRCQSIRAANQKLQPFVELLRLESQTQREQAGRQAQAETVLASREYSFCLYPEQSLRDFMLEIHSHRP